MYSKRRSVKMKKSYDEDFKKMVVELYENKKAATEIQREYGISSSTLYKWISEYKGIKTETGEITNNKELKKLKKELAELKQENEILKKAVAIFTHQ